MNTDKQFLRESEVSDLISVPSRTLQRWRLEQRGPAYKKLGGHVRYPSEDLERWIAAAPSGGERGQ